MGLAEVAGRAALSESSLSRIERGLTGLSVQKLMQLCGILKVSAADVIDGGTAHSSPQRGGSRRDGEGQAERAATKSAAVDFQTPPKAVGAELVTWLSDTIAARISSGEFKQGHKLRQEALAKEFNVSRTPVREALRQLVAHGLVLHAPKYGSIVRPISSKQIRDAYQVRSELEGLAAELAAEWINDEQIARLRKAEQLFAASVAGEASGAAENEAMNESWVGSNETFHDIILEASNNRKLTESVRKLHLSFTRPVMVMAAGMDKRRMRENVDQHDAIMQALIRRDGAAARLSMVHHIHRAGELAAYWLEERGG